MLKKIVAIGPESTGKSTLCRQLANYYRTLWCPEYAREYLSEHGTKYNYDDLRTIATGQVALEENYIHMMEAAGASTHDAAPTTTGTQALFIDTDMYVMKVWCQFVYGKCHQFILDQVAERKYDLYLLCKTDLAWQPDALREYPDSGTRQILFDTYKTILSSQATPWLEISGNNEQRLQKAVAAVDSLLKA